ncbi:MAG: TolC family protein [Planctomycetota bacterium]
MVQASLADPLGDESGTDDLVPAVVGLPVETSDWTLADLEAIALQTHPAIEKQRAAVRAACGRYQQAGLPLNPIAQYQSQEIGNEDSTGLHSVTVSQPIVTANKLGIAQQVRSREVQKEQARLLAAKLKVTARVRSSFALAQVAQQRMELTQTIWDLSQKAESSVEGLVSAGQASRLALLQARVETEKARIQFENAEAKHHASLRSLAAAVGDPVIAYDRLAGELPVPTTGPPWDQLLDQIGEASPEISLAGSELARARWALKLACAQVVPNVTGQAGVGYDSATDDTFAVIGISVPLPVRNRNQGNIRSARADMVAAAAAIDETRLSLEGRMAESVGRYQMAQQRYSRMSELMVPAAEEAYDLASKAFEAGEIDYLQLLTAQRTLFDTRLTLLEAIGQAAVASAEIETLLVGMTF